MSALKKTFEDSLQALVAIGDRANGTVGNHRAEAYIAQQFTSWGYEVTRQEYECPVWECDSQELTSGDERFAIMGNPFTPAVDIEAEVVKVGVWEELERADISGKIVLLTAELAKEPYFPKNFTYYNPDEHKRVIALLEERKPAAVIAVSPKPGNEWPIFEDPDFSIPSATISIMEGMRFARMTHAHLTLASRITPGTTANVVARKTGSANERIVIGGHYDTKYGTSGAFDNAGGAALVMALAKHFADVETNIALEFVAFTGEENMPLGSPEYIRLNEDTLKDIRLAIIPDGIGHVISRDAFALSGVDDTVASKIQEIARKYLFVSETEPWYQGDQSLFMMNGVPAMPVGPMAFPDICHTGRDVIEGVDIERCARMGEFLSEVVKVF